ncbi:3'(2'),5'-bisphosphate nucleotidase CysQ [Loktanella sp. SALINAS62]|uniref:3'(2'),5'-bisphosphate nucleotidase CysQ n=1 Tax=Loktanella sp. SALINAS62 TaxID=2706124 RepID=UPI001B8BB59C|nr:3'(2'),5'-bisphosphate nucleotidase CysQ [Loktanella sp. SALINAS62]MBS1302325.1 3'(2'),5'-bisphosphate nucleotidase CysQ [Loktanella sp. SALINAS62]
MPAIDLPLLIDAARAAGDISLSFLGRNPQVWQKPGDAGPVTEADIAINRMLGDRLRSARPDYGWLSEESEDDPHRQNAARTFIIDPIDGTNAFIRGDKDWAHAFAVVEDGVPIAGVVFMPARSLMFAAAQGQGATCNGRPISVSALTHMNSAQVLTTKPNMAPHHWKGATPPFQRGFRSSLAYRMALAAEGKFDAMLTLHPTWEWDIAAGAILVAEAGGQVTDKRGKPLRFNSRNRQLDGVLAGGAIVTSLLDALV